MALADLFNLQVLQKVFWVIQEVHMETMHIWWFHLAHAARVSD